MIKLHFKTFKGSNHHKELENFVANINTYVVDAYDQSFVRIKYLKGDD